MGDRPQGWLFMAEFDPSPGGAFVATYSDGSGARLFLATDDGVLDGEDLDPYDCDHTEYSLYSWLPADFRVWGQDNLP